MVPSRYQYKIFAVPVILLILSLACSLPGLRRPTPTSSLLIPTPAMPTATAALLPPALVEVHPLPRSEIALDASITMVFNQPMDRTSVEGALAGMPALTGKITWENDRTMIFTPDVPFLPGTDLSVTVNTTARSQRGLTMSVLESISYRTVSSLLITQKLPFPEAMEVEPDSAVVVSFNQPVVALGADMASLPAAFTLDPPTAGKSEWLNTSTFIFYPEPALTGGLLYTVRLNPDLKSTLGAPLAAVESWTFSVAMPRLLSAEPSGDGASIRLDTPVKLTFNQAMDAESVLANFALLDAAGQRVPGTATWNPEMIEMVFTPAALLGRGSTYTTRLNAEAQNSAGIPLGKEFTVHWQTVPPLNVVPLNLGPADKPAYEAAQLFVSAPLPAEALEPYFSFEPPLANFGYFQDETGHVLYLSGDFEADTDYTLQVSPNLADAWGARLGTPLNFSFHTAPLEPTLTFTVGSPFIFLTPGDRTLSSQAASLSSVQSFIGTVPLADFIQLVGPQGYAFQENYRTADEQSWLTTLDVSATRVQTVDLPVSPSGEPLAPGLYFLRYENKAYGYQGPFTLIVSNINLALKINSTEAFLWAVDLRSGEPVSGAPVTIYDSQGTPLSVGLTGENGIYQAPIPVQQVPYQTYFAVLGQPGEDRFSLALSTWAEGISPGNFGIQEDRRPPGVMTYLYTDRPIYQPGQTVYFRAAAREAYNGIYSMPTQPSLLVEIFDGMGNQLSSSDDPLSSFGTVHGEYRLADDAEPGYYRLQSGQDSISFQVAEYRKPEIDLKVSFAADQVQVGQDLSASVSARYFFDAPAGNVALRWALYKSSAWFSIPGYQVGAEDTGWLEVAVYPDLSGNLGDLVAEGEGMTDQQGLFTLQVPTTLDEKKAPRSQRYTLEVTLQDESRLPVSGRDTILVHPAAFYIGLHPDVWVGQAGVAAGFELITTDWDGIPTGDRTLHAEFRKVTWTRQEPEQPGAYPVFAPEYTPISSADLMTGSDGLARLSFTPPEPGTYQLEVSGDGTLSQVTLWVGGDGQAVWPQLPNQRLRLTSDSNYPYLPGQTAQVFIPNPFGHEVPALVTIERATVLRYEVIQLSGQGTLLPIPLTEEDAPTVYISVLLLDVQAGNQPDFRLGYLTLEVDPVHSILHVELTRQPETAEPGEEVTLGVRVTDSQGSPVQGEFSIAVVDAAVLALADANAPTIREAFYGEQPIGMHTNLSLAAYANRSLYQAGGVGGGGDEGSPPAVREDFLDTAFWKAEIVTNSDGAASVALSLPDNLTTWKILVRGLTADTRVGESETQVVATKDLLIRPVTPRFMVAGDHVLLAGIVQNNTPSDLQAEVSLQGIGFVLDEAGGSAGAISRQVSLPSGGRQRVEWWGTAQDVPSLDLIFSVQAGELRDEIRISGLPALQYTAPQAFATVGLLEEAGERVELVSLPASLDQRQAEAGELRLSLSPSLAAAALEALAVLERSPSLYNEQDLSVSLPAVILAQTVQSFGVTAPELQSRLDATLPERLNLLLAHQNEDGGWGWWPGGESDPFHTTYILFGLTQFQEAGASIPSETIRQAVDYLLSGLPAATMLSEGWQLDRLAFEHFALEAAGSGDQSGAQALYEVRGRLSPWAQALLAFILEELTPGSSQAQTILSDLQAGAMASSTGAHWEDQNAGWRNMSSTVSTSAVVAYVLAQREPASPILLQAMRFLMASRQPDGAWASSYDTAWSLLAVAEFMRGTGELSGNFSFSAAFNDLELAAGEAGGDARLKPVTAVVPAADMFPENPNALVVRRSAGTGRLYYTAVLDINLPAEQAAPFNGGLTISRAYYPIGEDCQGEPCQPVTGSAANKQVLTVVTLAVPQDAYYVRVEDAIPAGSEILDTSLKISQLGAFDVPEEAPVEQGTEPAAQFDPRHPFAAGWGWWYFQRPHIFDDHIAWSADFLPAGTYVLQYTLTALQPGVYRVLPASARQVYFPEIQGSSAGTIFTIAP
jgi:uncharacterized protein YfaS (alpha-2-macroglobulin family)